MKRFFDFSVSLLALIFLSVPLALIFFLTQMRLGRPAIFKQLRPGLGGHPFLMYKFRTMNDERDAQGELLPGAKRVTPFGRFLRSSSLDELPGLWNVLKGDMSLVGPRPLLMSYLSLYSSAQMRRHDVRPGLTGWAQVNGRNLLTWDEKFALDVWYVDNANMLLDLKILVLTVKKVLLREGINSSAEVTMSPFRGTGRDGE